MQVAHRLYEVDCFSDSLPARRSLSFVEDFNSFLADCFAKPPRDADPRKRINMAPEPYRPDLEIAGDPIELKKRAWAIIEPNLMHWEWLYRNLEDAPSKRLLLFVLAYRTIGWRYVTMPLDNDRFWGAVTQIASIAYQGEIPEVIRQKNLHRFNLDVVGRDVTVYSDAFGVFNEFIYPQYSYRGVANVIAPAQGDVVLDCGACYGGTAVNFCDLVGPDGRVYAFEFVKGNIDVFHWNVHDNVQIQNRICLVEQPVWSQSDLTMSIVGSGPGTQVHFADIDGAKKVQSIRIDDFVSRNGLPRVNFIKMDVEGAEMEALKGAFGTIDRFRPKMAICVYHLLTDFYEVARLLRGIHGDYRLYLGHSTTHGDETVLFAA